MDFHIKPIQRQIQAHTFSLQKGFLAGPTATKTGKPHVRRKAIQGEQLAGGEMVVRDLRVDGLHVLKIDPEVVVAAHGKSGDVTAVSQVEMNRLRGGVELNSRLA